MNWLKHNWLKLYFLLATALLMYILGMASAAIQLPPFQWMIGAFSAYKDWTSGNNYKHYTKARPEKYILKSRTPTDGGVTINKASKVQPGFTFITSVWDPSETYENFSNGFNLIDMDGTLLHSWRVSITDIWSDTPNWPQKKVSDWNTDIHGAVMYPNGDVVFNFEYHGLVKINKCSEVLWKLKNQTHHSVEFDPTTDNLWVGSHYNHYKYNKRMPEGKYPMLEPLVREDTIIKVSPTGKVIEEISILESIYKSDYEGLLFADGNSGVRKTAGDISHMNDVEALSPEMATNFPLFEAGDLLVSLRNLNLIMVLDGETHKIKWEIIGPFIHQHDPDFLPNGKIAVFDNRYEDDYTDGTILGGSRIIEIDPVTRDVKVLFESSPDFKFYTSIRGKQQHLANGNMLLTEHKNGKLIEVTPQQEVVWSFVNKLPDNLGDNEVLQISDGIRYDYEYPVFLKEKDTCN